ncbi:histidinol-phosphatase HisJ family protein [Marinilabiliaceae bacterium JC017]|nr:histidinol-phosphatase HisJ family protein [Marinilabiliaceae bacterium JC017]
MKFSLHTHSPYCDGKSTMDEICQTAVNKGLQMIGFSGHAPVPFKTKWAMGFDDLTQYQSDIYNCQKSYEGTLQIYKALEVDYVPGFTVSLNEWRRIVRPDYLIGSVHLVKGAANDALWFLDGPPENYDKGINEIFGGDYKKAVRAYYHQLREMIQEGRPEIIGHMDKVVMNNQRRYFDPEADWHMIEVEKTLRIIKAYGCIVEINTRGIYRGKYDDFFPSASIIQKCIELHIPLTISSDAHHCIELDSGFEDAAKTMVELGGKELTVLNKGVWEQISLGDVIS